VSHPVRSGVHRVTLAKDVVVQVIGGDALVLNLRDETVFSLNPTGARIAELIRTGISLDEVIDALCREYGADREEVARDVDDLVSTLLSRGLVVRTSDEEAL
jgi:hypothetical protein